MTKLVSTYTAIIVFIALIVLDAPIWLLILSGLELVCIFVCFVSKFLQVCTQKDTPKIPDDV